MPNQQKQIGFRPFNEKDWRQYEEPKVGKMDIQQEGSHGCNFSNSVCKNKNAPCHMDFVEAINAKMYYISFII
jgi:hypothetical protein